MEAIDVISVVLRAVAFITALQAAGLALFGASCRAAGITAVNSVDKWVRVAALCAVPFVLAYRGLDAGRLAGDWSGVVDAHLQGMVWTRVPGVSSIVCVLGLFGLANGTGAITRWPAYGPAIGAFPIIGSFALAGHATEAHHSGLAQALLTLHVAIAAYWTGAVVGLYAFTRQSDARAVASAAARFSAVAIWLVPVLLPVGGLMVWVLVPDLSALDTPYGALLLVKTAGFCGLLVLAAMNRLRLLPALTAGTPAAIKRFQRILIVDYLLLGGVLVATATMTSLFSPR